MKKKDILHRIDNVIKNMYSSNNCSFTKDNEMKLSLIADKLNVWIKDDDVKFLNTLSPVEAFKNENMLILEHCIETAIDEITYTYLILNFDNRSIMSAKQEVEQIEIELDDEQEESVDSDIEMTGFDTKPDSSSFDMFDNAPTF